MVPSSALEALDTLAMPAAMSDLLRALFTFTREVSLKEYVAGMAPR